MTMKIKLEMINRSQRYNVNRPRLRHRDKCTKYKMCHSTIIVTCIKQRLNNI